MNKETKFEKKMKNSRNPKSIPFLVFQAGSFAVRDHFRSNLGIISGRGSFAALYRCIPFSCRISLFRYRDVLQSGCKCCADLKNENKRFAHYTVASCYNQPKTIH